MENISHLVDADEKTGLLNSHVLPVETASFMGDEHPKSKTVVKKPLFYSRFGSFSFYGFFNTNTDRDGSSHKEPHPPDLDKDSNNVKCECCSGMVFFSFPYLSSNFASLCVIPLVSVILIIIAVINAPSTSWLWKLIYTYKPVGPYKLVERHVGHNFLNYYNFYDGPDSLGSAGYNRYVSKKMATETLEIFRVVTESSSNSSPEEPQFDDTFIYMSSKAMYEEKSQHRFHPSINRTSEEKSRIPLPRASIRLEGKRRFNRGLFLLDVRHIPVGCGVWPAFWLTDEDYWPNHGEIDIVEGINYQSVAKTALHTRDQCSMYAHVPESAKSGTWDWAVGIPNRFTGLADNRTAKQADNCWELAAHQWYNQGCVAVSSEEGTLGKSFNENGGGVYALEWDPSNGYIKSWVFAPREKIPTNVLDVVEYYGKKTDTTGNDVLPNPDEWGLPYAYFAIGEATGCSSDHFVNLRIVFNLAFCGNVAGNRYFGDCPDQSNFFRVENNDPIASCVKWIQSNPKELDDHAFWKIKGVYVFERELKLASEKKK